MMKKYLLLFDVDGTLLLSGGAGNRALNRSFYQEYGLINAMDLISPDGKTDPAIMREIFQKKLDREPKTKEIEKLCQIYLRFLEEEIELSAGYRLLPGILPLLEETKRRSDLLIGLLTGNLKQGAQIKLTRSNLNRFFTFGGFGSDDEDRGNIAKLAVQRGRELAGELIPSDRIFVIGDTFYDIHCARAAGVMVIAVATGSTPCEELARYSPDYLMKDLSDREEFLSLIIYGGD